MEKEKKKQGIAKKSIVFMNCILIMIAIALAVFLVVLKKDKTNHEKRENTDIQFITEEVNIQIDEERMKNYVSEKLGVKIKYDKDLEKVSEINDNTMYNNIGMFRKEGNEGLHIIIGNLSEDIALEDYMYASVEAIRNSNGLTKEDIVVIKDNVKMGELEAFKLRYKVDGIYFYQMITIKDKKEYVVTYSAEEKFYDKSKADNMFSTFEFIS